MTVWPSANRHNYIRQITFYYLWVAKSSRAYSSHYRLTIYTQHPYICSHEDGTKDQLSSLHLMVTYRQQLSGCNLPETLVLIPSCYHNALGSFPLWPSCSSGHLNSCSDAVKDDRLPSTSITMNSFRWQNGKLHSHDSRSSGSSLPRLALIAPVGQLCRVWVLLCVNRRRMEKRKKKKKKASAGRN